MINLNDDLGYVYISETSIADDRKLVSNINVTDVNNIFFVTFDTNLQSFGDINRNQRSYLFDNVWECIQQEKIQCLLRDGCWFGEFDHPTPEYQGQKLSPERIQNVPPAKRTFKIMKPRKAGDLLQATIQSAQTEIGIGFGKEILAGWIPSFSARAIASLKLINGKPTVIVRRLITYDSVWYPSHKRAHAITKAHPVMKKIQTFNESAEDSGEYVETVLIPLKEILESVGKTDVNTQMIMESFELPMENLYGFTESRNQVIIKDDDNMIYANISPKTKKKVDDFFNSFNI